MKFLGMGGFEFVIILIVILVIFGPKNLPKLGKAFGKTVSNLREGINEGKKKPGDAESADAVDEVVAESTVAEPVPAQLESASESPAEVIAEGDVIESAEAAASAAEAAADEAFQSKRVKRVVKKRVE